MGNNIQDKQAPFYVMVLDVNLQRIYGFTIFEETRQFDYQTAIITLTARNSDKDKIHELKKALMMITVKLLKKLIA